MDRLPLEEKIALLMSLAGDDREASPAMPLPPRLRHANDAGALRPLNFRTVAAVPQRWREWVKPGGRLFAVVGEAPAMTARLVTCSAPGACGSVDLFETVIAPLANAEQPPRFKF